MWILFQIKRFFFIFKKESFLFFKQKFYNGKNSINNITFFKKKGIPLFEKEIKINLEKKYYDFYTLQPKNEKPFYLNSPLFIIIQQNKKEILNNLLHIFEYNYSFKLKIGVELEFYIYGNNNINIIKELKKLLVNILDIEKERGNNQFEIKTVPYTNIQELLYDYLNINNTLNNFAKQNDLIFDLSPVPFEKDCGSALQINISLTETNKNLFARTKFANEFLESKLMLNSIAGLLKNINNNLLFFIKDKDCLNRFNFERNKKIRNDNKYTAPTFISWGINNRSASIRIPTPSQINLENYLKEDDKGRRIEYRIPSANADIYMVLIGIFISIIEGIDNELLPHIEKTSFDVLENNKDLEKIENNFYIINDSFKINQDILYF